MVPVHCTVPLCKGKGVKSECSNSRGIRLLNVVERVSADLKS